MKRIVAVTLGLAAALASATPALAASPEAVALKRALGPAARVAEHRETGKVRFVGSAPGRPIARPGGLGPSASPAEVAREFLGRHGAAFGIAGKGHALRSTATDNGARGRSAVRFQQLVDGIPVLGGEFVVNLDARRNVLSAAGEASPADVDTAPRVTSAAARDAAVAAVAKAHRIAGARLRAEIPALAIYDAGILGGPGPERPRLVWRLEVKGAGGLVVDQLVLVDAELGSVALTIDQIEHAKNRSVCNANNTATQVPCVSPVRTEGGPPVGTPADVNLAYDYSGDTYDFFFDRFARDSLDGAGLPLRSTVRYCDPAEACPYQNAFWNGQQMVYGAGFAAADDVVGHELTHGVTDFSAHLFYYYQSGAINESLSDVFGEFIDLTNGSGTDTAGVRWKMGEDVPGFGAIRDMANPPSLGDPDRMTSPNYTADAGEDDSGGVHTNSGVNNKAAFLMADGGSFNGRTVTALGIEKASRIYYRVQTSMLTSASDYADLASALPQACNDLVGTAGITAADCTEVSDAVAAVEMATSPPAAPSPEAPVCATGLMPTTRFADNLENTLSGNWAKSAGGDWYYPQNSHPFAFDATYATSGDTNLWGYDRPTPADYSIAMTRSVDIPAGSTAFLRFNHAYGFEDDATGAYDGGVLEVSTNGGASYTDAGPLLSDNGYDGTLVGSGVNPLRGRGAFVRESNGYRSTRANLSSLGGQSVRFRFRIGTDASLDDFGWWVDDIAIYTCAPPAPPDADGDGVPDGSDACPSDPASTPNGCPVRDGGGGTGGGGSTGGGSTGGTGGAGGTGGGGATATLASARVKSCKRTGRGRKARVRCTLAGFGAVRSVRITVLKGRRALLKKTVKPTARGIVSVRPRRALRRGRYTVKLRMKDAQGKTRTITKRLRVR